MISMSTLINDNVLNNSSLTNLIGNFTHIQIIESDDDDNYNNDENNFNNITTSSNSDLILRLCNKSINNCLNKTNDNYHQTEMLQNRFSFQIYINFRFYLSWISLVVILIGLIGNLISFIILISPKMRIATNVFLSSLCVSGFLALFGFLINSVTYELAAYYNTEALLSVLFFFYPYFYPIITTFQMASILLTVCVSVNQFMCIYFARVRNNNNKRINDNECKNALIVVLVMLLISILYNIPYWLKFKYSNGYLIQTEIGKNELFNKIVHFWLYLPIVYIIPFSILIMTNSYLSYRILKARRKRKRLGLDKKVNNSAKQLKMPILNNNNNNTSNETVQANFNESSNLVTNKISEINNQSNTKNHQKDRVKVFQQKNININTNNKTGSKNITIMLIAVVFFFFICQFPNLILHIFQSMVCSTYQSLCVESAVYKYSIVICKFLLICNLSFNFAFYCLFSEKFRDVFKEFFNSKFVYCFRK